MNAKIFQQVGHNSNWNRDSLIEDNVGDGLIFSPVHQNKSAIEKIESEIKEKSFFDPQYYLPSSQKNKLQTYNFFPEVIAQGFDTVDFAQLANKSAQECLNFQLDQGFSRIVIPTRFFREMITDFQQRQEAYSVTPFLEELNGIAYHPPVLLTLPLTSSMIMDEGYRRNILNWVTSHQRIDGVYLFVVDDRNTKQYMDSAQLIANLKFFEELRNADLELVIGYCNTEALLYLMISGCSVSLGSFENTRMFSIEKFMKSDESRRGPKARIYLPGLLNWILFSEAKDIRNRFPKIWKQIHIPTKYSEKTFEANVEPTFNQPDLYKHHFITMNQQASELLSYENVAERKRILNRMVSDSISQYQVIGESGISLNQHSCGDHLNAWNHVLSHFK